MLFKRLDINDIDKVKEIVMLHRNLSVSSVKVTEFLKNDKNYLIGCLVKDKIVGFVLAYEIERYDNNNNMMYLHEIGVLEDYRKRGIGKRLIDELKMICKDREIMKMFLITNKSNIPAVSLYKSTGGKATEEDDIVFTYEQEDF